MIYKEPDIWNLGSMLPRTLIIPINNRWLTGFAYVLILKPHINHIMSMCTTKYPSLKVLKQTTFAKWFFFWDKAQDKSWVWRSRETQRPWRRVTPQTPSILCHLWMRRARNWRSTVGYSTNENTLHIFWHNIYTRIQRLWYANNMYT